MRAPSPSPRGGGAVGQCAAHQSATARALRRGQVQAELAAPPQHVVGAARPLVVVQVAQLGLVQPGRDLGAERRRRASSMLDARAVGARQALQQRRRQLGMAHARAPARSARSRCRAAAACRSRRSGRRRAAGAPRVQAAPRRSPSGAASRSAASSASLRKVVILPPQTVSSGAPPRRRARAGSRASPPTGRPIRRRAAAARPE